MRTSSLSPLEDKDVGTTGTAQPGLGRAIYASGPHSQQSFANSWIPGANPLLLSGSRLQLVSRETPGRRARFASLGRAQAGPPTLAVDEVSGGQRRVAGKREDEMLADRRAGCRIKELAIGRVIGETLGRRGEGAVCDDTPFADQTAPPVVVFVLMIVPKFEIVPAAPRIPTPSRALSMVPRLVTVPPPFRMTACSVAAFIVP